MPTEKTPDNADQVIDPAKNNEEVARKLASQDIAGQSTVTGEFGEATAALDALAAQVKPKDDTTSEPKPGDAPPAPKAGDASSPPKKGDAPAAPKAGDTPPAPNAEEEALKKRAESLFKDSPTLPPNASPKSAEAFSSIKIKAARDISEREAQIETLRKEIEASKNPTPERLAMDKELEDLRTWRARMDVEFDPKFKEFDKSISQSREFIYSQLAKSPVITPEVIAQIKKYGGPDMVKLDKILASVNDPTIQRLVESKVADIEMAKYNREQAVNSAKANVTQYLQERQQETVKAASASRQEATTKLEGMLGNLGWFAEKKVDASAEPAARVEAEDHNKFLSDLKGQVSAALQDDTPEMRAILITGMAQLFHLQRRVPTLEAQIASLTKERDEAVTKYGAIKQSSRSRLSESQAPSGGIPAASGSGTNVNQRPQDALDEIAKKVMEERAAKGQ